MLLHFRHLLDFVQADQRRRFAIKTYGKICLFIINEYFAIFLTTALGHGGLLAKQYFCDRCMCTWDEILRQEFWANLHILIEGINYHICIVARIAVQTDCQVPLLSIYVHFDISQASRKPRSHFWPFFKGITFITCTFLSTPLMAYGKRTFVYKSIISFVRSVGLVWKAEIEC